MTNKWLDTSLIEDYFYNILSSANGKLGTLVAGKKLPDTLDKNVERMTLISCGNMRDRGGYGQGVVLLFLFCKSADNGTKNVPVMFDMEEALRPIIENATHEHYVISRGSTDTDYYSTYDMHCNIVEINLIIK